MDEDLIAAAAKELELGELAKRFRSARGPDDGKRLGDELGRLIFSCEPKLKWSLLPIEWSEFSDPGEIARICSEHRYAFPSRTNSY